MSNLATEMRERRSSASRIKLEISKLRAEVPNRLVFVFEGKDDKFAYRSWIKRCSDELRYEPIIAEGKRNVLSVRKMILRDLTGSFGNVYFVIDRDFDDYQGEHVDNTLFCTDRYSVENYLVEHDVVDNVLCDNFHCHGNWEQRRIVLASFESALQDFNSLCKDVNERLFYARRLGIRIISGIPEISSCVKVELSSCIRRDDRSAKDFLPLEREPTEQEIVGLAEEFASFEPRARYRGKFLMEFFKKWLRHIAADSSAEVRELFKEPVRPPVDANVLTIGMLAVHSSMPATLPEFVRRVAA